MQRLTLRDSQPAEFAAVSHRLNFDIDVPALALLLLRKRRWIIGIVGGVAVIAALAMMMTPNRYTSQATILPSGKTDQFSALKAMAGLTGAFGTNEENSSALYPVILNSNLVRDSVLAGTYTYTDHDTTVTQTLTRYFGNRTPDRLHHALSSMTGINANTRTGEITVAVETEHPRLSQGIVSAYLHQLENYNLYSRRSEARDRVRYLTREVDDRKAALAAAEDTLAEFQERNRNWAATTEPTVLKRLGRLKRDVELKSQTLAYLLQQFEAARLDAQKDVPIVRILDAASLPTVKSGPHRTFAVLGSAFVAFLLVVFGIIVLDLVGQIWRGSDAEGTDRLAAEMATMFPRSRRWCGAIRKRLAQEPISVDSTE